MKSPKSSTCELKKVRLQSKKRKKKKKRFKEKKDEEIVIEIFSDSIKKKKAKKNKKTYTASNSMTSNVIHSIFNKTDDLVFRKKKTKNHVLLNSMPSRFEKNSMTNNLSYTTSIMNDSQRSGRYVQQSRGNLSNENSIENVKIRSNEFQMNANMFSMQKSKTPKKQKILSHKKSKSFKIENLTIKNPFKKRKKRNIETTGNFYHKNSLGASGSNLETSSSIKNYKNNQFSEQTRNLYDISVTSNNIDSFKDLNHKNTNWVIIL